MDRFNQLVLFLHFLGLALGFATSFANMSMSRVMAEASLQERAVLGRFPPVMSRIGKIGLALLWVTGLMLWQTKWSFASWPWQFHAKLTSVVLLTVTVTYIHWQERKLQRGDISAAARIGTAGKFAMIWALLALAFAVLTFD
jgi:uncharacterized membrane protein